MEASQQLARNYGDLVKRRPVLQQVVTELNLPYGPGPLAGKITVRSPRSLINIRVRDPDPESAAKIADTVARIFIDDFRSRQLTQIAQFQASLSQYGISEDPSIFAAQASTLSTLSVVEPALPPLSPYSPRTKLNILLGVVLGLLVVGLVVFLLEYLDERIKSIDELGLVTGLNTAGSGMPTFGTVLNYGASDDGRGPIIYSQDHQQSPLVEAYKFLQTNLEFAALDSEAIKTLLVTSSAPREGKTTTAANLAISVAREGKPVILVDADLRKPGLHRIFDIADHKGLTNLLLGNATLDEALAQTQIQGLRVIFSGPLPPVPQNERAGRGAQELRRTGYLRQPAPPLGDRPHACGVSGRRCTPCGRRPAHTTGRGKTRGGDAPAGESRRHRDRIEQGQCQRKRQLLLLLLLLPLLRGRWRGSEAPRKVGSAIQIVTQQLEESARW